jgi:hypothetical protein
MAVPVVLTETVAITELALLFSRSLARTGRPPPARLVRRRPQNSAGPPAGSSSSCRLALVKRDNVLYY